MKFNKDLIRPLIEGTKTQTRRLHEQPKYSIGEVVKVFIAGDASENELSKVRLRITGIRIEKLKDISAADIKAEGFNSLSEFRTFWERCYPGTWGDNPEVVVYEFERW